MSKQDPRDERIERFDIVYELPPSAQGSHQYGRNDGTVVHGDASGEWTLDENGDADIVFFGSPGWIRNHRKKTAE